MAEPIEITEQLPPLPETASKYNEQFLDDMDKTLDILPSWTTKLNTLANQINSFRSWIVSQMGFFQRVIDKADAIDGYVIPVDVTYPANKIDADFKSVYNSFYAASGVINPKPKKQTFFETDIPNTIAYTGETVTVDGVNYEIGNKNIGEVSVLALYAGVSFSSLLLEIGKYYIVDVDYKVNAKGPVFYGCEIISSTNNTGIGEIYTYNLLNGKSSYLVKYVGDSDYGFRFYFKNYNPTINDLNISIKEAILITLPEAPTAKVETSTTTVNAYEKGDFAVINNDIYQSQTDTTVGSLLTDTTKFLPKSDVNGQDILLHRVHKTTNAYDLHSYRSLNQYTRDEINQRHPVMSKEGYGYVVGKGLWEDATYYYALMGVVQRLNQGAYHPVLNSLGCGYIRGQEWYHTYNVSSELIDTIERSSHGKMETLNQRPDSKYYDKIYLDQMLDCRISATSTCNAQLLRDTVRDDLNGTTKGIGAGVKINKVNIVAIASGSSAYIADKEIDGVVREDLMNCAFVNNNGMFKLTQWVSDYHFRVAQLTPSGWTNEIDISLINGIDSYLVQQNNHLSQGTQLTTDVAGSFDDYPPSWKDYLAEGKSINFNPLVVGQDGADYVDTSASKSYIVSRKLENEHLRMGIFNSIASSVRTTGSIATNTNTIYFAIATYPVNHIRLVQYESHNDILHPYTEGTPLTKELIVYASNHHDIEKGATLANSLTGKVSTGTDTLEELTITRVIGDAYEYIATIQTSDVHFIPFLEKDTATGLKKIVYNYSTDGGNTWNKKQRILREYA